MVDGPFPLACIQSASSCRSFAKRTDLVQKTNELSMDLHDIVRGPLGGHPHQNNPSANMSSLAASAEAKILEELVSQVASENAKSLFAIGGTISVTALDDRLICESDKARSDGHHSADESNATGMGIWEISDDEDNPKQDNPRGDVHRMRCDPVTLRWDSDDSAGCKVTLPCADADRPNFEQLLKDCQPASFGRGGEDVMDESYRKAGKIDESAFCSNFSPYALGIVDTAAQALTPNLAHQTNESHGLRAELYKLNVSDSPFGVCCRPRCLIVYRFTPAPLASSKPILTLPDQSAR